MKNKDFFFKFENCIFILHSFYDNFKLFFSYLLAFEFINSLLKLKFAFILFSTYYIPT